MHRILEAVGRCNLYGTYREPGYTERVFQAVPVKIRALIELRRFQTLLVPNVHLHRT